MTLGYSVLMALGYPVLMTLEQGVHPTLGYSVLMTLRCLIPLALASGSVGVPPAA